MGNGAGREADCKDLRNAALGWGLAKAFTNCHSRFRV
jgi:hypothetical protein